MQFQHFLAARFLVKTVDILRHDRLEPALRWMPEIASFLQRIILGTAWLGALVGLLLVLGRPGWRASDALAGLLAGLAGGVIAAATLGCLLPYMEAGWGAGVPELPRLVLVWSGLGALAGWLGRRWTSP